MIYQLAHLFGVAGAIYRRRQRWIARR